MNENDTAPINDQPSKRSRLAALVAWMLLIVGSFALAETVSGPLLPGESANGRAPVIMAGVVGPSPRSSPGVVQAMNVDAQGNTLVNGTVSVGPSPLNANVSGTVSVGPSPINVFVKPSPVVLAAGTNAANVTLPAASPVPVQGMLPSGSPVGSLASMPVTPVPKTVLSGSASSAADLITTTNVTGFHAFALQLSGTWSGNVQIQGSNDATTWTALCFGQLNTSTSATAGTTLTVPALVTGQVETSYVRVTCTSYSSGTVSANLTLSPLPIAQNYSRLLGSVQGAAAQGATASGNPVRVGGVYQSSPSTLSDGQVGTPLLSDKGILRVVPSHVTGVELTGSAGLVNQGSAAHGSSLAGNPFRIGARGVSSSFPSVTADQTTDVVATLAGQLRTVVDINSSQVGYDAFRSVQVGNVSIQVKSGAGVCGPLRIGNPNTQACYLHVYNTANASITVGSTTPVCTYFIPASGSIDTPGPITHSTAICIAATNSTSDDEMAAGNLIVSGGYK